MGGTSLAGSWQIDGEVSLPICSLVFEGHAAVVRLEISSGSNISVKLHLESKLKLPCFGIDLRLVLVSLILFRLMMDIVLKSCHVMFGDVGHIYSAYVTRFPHMLQLNV